MNQNVIHLSADTEKPLFLWFEPWADGVAFPAGSEIEIRAESELPGQLELEADSERTVVYGWGGATLDVLVNGNMVKSYDTPAPDFMNSNWVKMIFGPPPTPSDEDKAKLTK